MQTIHNRTIAGETLQIDNMTYSDCLLTDCTLEYSGGPVAFQRTRVRNCQYVFFGSARRTVHFLQGVGLLADSPELWAEFSDLVH